MSILPAPGGNDSHRNLGTIEQARLASLVLSAAIGLLAAGCAVMKGASADQLNGQRLSEERTPVAHLYIDNWGIYLFKHIPS